MKLAYALHEIRRNKKAETVGSILELTEKEFADLLKLGAVRAASDAEAQIFANQNGRNEVKAAEAAPAMPKSTRGRKAKDAESEKGAEPEQSQDPDEVDL